MDKRQKCVYYLLPNCQEGEKTQPTTPIALNSETELWKKMYQMKHAEKFERSVEMLMEMEMLNKVEAEKKLINLLIKVSLIRKHFVPKRTGQYRSRLHNNLMHFEPQCTRFSSHSIEQADRLLLKPNSTDYLHLYLPIFTNIINYDYPYKMIPQTTLPRGPLQKCRHVAKCILARTPECAEPIKSWINRLAAKKNN
ncbi:unnamed protein product [Caenorhabditis nigoni]